MANEESFSYRRGLTLGLTMAEIFLLILFILLLIFLALNREYEEIKDTLVVTQETLTATQAELKVVSAENKKLAELPKEIEHLKRVNSELSKNNNEIELASELQALRAESESLANQNENLQEQNSRLRHELGSKGVDPACWYEIVTDEDGTQREKTYYLFDVAVYENHMLIRINENIPPPGRGDNKNGQPAPTSYAEEYKKLPLADLRDVREKKVSLEEFTTIAAPIRNMGKDEQIRDYSCVFYAKIWDYTAETAKGRWKQARERIENFFYPLVIKNDPWK